MKKWILVVLLYGLGGLFIYDVLNDLAWAGEGIDKLIEYFPGIAYFSYLLFMMVLFLILLCNYFILRIRAKNPAFTLINSIFMTVFALMMLMRTTVSYSAEFSELFAALGEVDNWKFIWTEFPTIIAISGLNIVSGVVISEAKTKGAYLSAEFVYLFTGIILVMFTLIIL